MVASAIHELCEFAEDFDYSENTRVLIDELQNYTAESMGALK
jgi:hypothetical protein